MSNTDKVFAGSVPKLYDTHMVPLIFEPYADDLVKRLAARPLARVLEIAAGTGVVTRRMAESLPMKLAVFDGENGMLALLDPVITRPTWTAVVFRHEGMGEAMKALFEERWRRGTDL